MPGAADIVRHHDSDPLENPWVDGQPPSALRPTASNGGGLQPAQGTADPRHLRAGFRGRRVDLSHAGAGRLSHRSSSR